MQMLLNQGLAATMNIVNIDPEEAARKAEEQARKKREREERERLKREAEEQQKNEASAGNDESVAI